MSRVPRYCMARACCMVIAVPPPPLARRWPGPLFSRRAANGDRGAAGAGRGAFAARSAARCAADQARPIRHPAVTVLTQFRNDGPIRRRGRARPRDITRGWLSRRRGRALVRRQRRTVRRGAPPRSSALRWRRPGQLYSRSRG
jgi:hypothetical protein